MHAHLYFIPLIAMAVVWLAMVILDLRFGVMRATDKFSSPASQFIAYAFLGVFLLLLTFLVVGSSMRVPTREQLAKTPFYQLFSLHAILIVFLFVWWLLTNRPNLLDYLNIQRRDFGKALLTGCAVGVGGWIFTIIMALVVGGILVASGLMPKNATPPPMIAWLVTMPLWKRGIVVLSAMTVEEAFFRGWLQKTLRPDRLDHPLRPRPRRPGTAVPAHRRKRHLARHRHGLLPHEEPHPGSHCPRDLRRRAVVSS